MGGKHAGQQQRSDHIEPENVVSEQEPEYKRDDEGKKSEPNAFELVLAETEHVNFERHQKHQIEQTGSRE